MSEQSPYEKLGVTEKSSFEEIQSAKLRLREKCGEDSQVLESIEAAYDAIIMDRLKLRQEGKIKVPEGIRFPERLVEPPQKKTAAAIPKPSSDWLQQFIDTPSRADILWPTVIFLSLAVSAVMAQTNDVSLLSLLMAIGVAANIYFINRKENKLGRAVLMTFAFLFFGLGFGATFANALGIGVIALGVEQFASLMTFCLLWLASSFLR